MPLHSFIAKTFKYLIIHSRNEAVVDKLAYLKKSLFIFFMGFYCETYLWFV